MKKSKTTKSQTALKIIKAQAKKKSSRLVKNTVDYYLCLANNCSGHNITKSTKQCKKNAPLIATAKAQEIQKITKAYQQIGISLRKLVIDSSQPNSPKKK